ncbi:serine/threonine-protein kinase ripk4 [Penicillium chrysogenum]|uniref:Serine/threonine-protein kinase ripk4 n=1 Tax=Penicillium chrysogenum TaxID=5076 RepID=A0ABQ8WWF5_PENCH|nr:serine/threonine-protein kinase ripk4 [Penicillium chrysogenum]
MRSDVIVHCHDHDGWTPLPRAAYAGHEEVVKLLLRETGIDADCKDSFARSPLIWAAKEGHGMVLELLALRMMWM